MTIARNAAACVLATSQQMDNLMASTGQIAAAANLVLKNNASSSEHTLSSSYK